MEAAAAFRDALVGLKSMHDADWLHRDLKPTNIGIIGTPARYVLLDVGTSAYLRPGSLSGDVFILRLKVFLSRIVCSCFLAVDIS